MNQKQQELIQKASNSLQASINIIRAEAESTAHPFPKGFINLMQSLEKVNNDLTEVLTSKKDIQHPWVIHIGAYRALHSDGVTRSTPLVKIKITDSTYEFIQQFANVTIDSTSLEKIYTINAVKFTVQPAMDESIKS